MPFSGALGAWPCLAPLGPPLKVMAPRSRLICLCVYLQNLKTISAQVISKKCMQILHRIGKLYHRFKQNVPESESRQFGRLRLRLRLLARCHDSGGLRLRLCTPAFGDLKLARSGRMTKVAFDRSLDSEAHHAIT